MIWAVARGLDPNGVRQREYMLRLANSQNETDKHISELHQQITESSAVFEARQDELATNQGSTNKHIKKMDKHIGELDQKVDLLLAQLLKNQDSKLGGATLQLHGETDYQEMKTFLVHVEMVSGLVGAALVGCIVAMCVYIRKTRA